MVDNNGHKTAYFVHIKLFDIDAYMTSFMNDP